MTPPQRDVAGADGVESGWNLLTRTLFRFCFSYFGLFCLIFPGFWFVYLSLFRRLMPEEALVWSLRPIAPLVTWVGPKVFGTPAALEPSSGGRDQVFQWVAVSCTLIVASVATLVWSILDRRRTQYRTLAVWFLLAMRLCLAGQMFYYGFAKVIPNQMPAPDLVTLMTSYGDFTPIMVLWNQVGASQPYQILLGAAEVLGGVLLLLPTTATVGALLSLVCMAQVFILNMTFDVPVKILSAHLLLLCLVLLAPDGRRLINVLVLDRTVAVSNRQHIPGTPRRRRVVATVQIVLLLWLAAGNLYQDCRLWHEIGGGRPVSALHGIWNVTTFTRDGLLAAPLLTDRNRWRTIILDNPSTATYQRMDDQLVPVEAVVDTAAHTLTLARKPPAVPDQFAFFDYHRPTPKTLQLIGTLDGHTVTISCDLVAADSFPLRSTGFHWIEHTQAQGIKR